MKLRIIFFVTSGWLQFIESAIWAICTFRLQSGGWAIEEPEVRSRLPHPNDFPECGFRFNLTDNSHPRNPAPYPLLSPPDDPQLP